MSKAASSLTYYDVEVGSQYLSPTRTIAECDLMQFAGLTGDFNELHTSSTFAEKSRFGQRIAHGMLILSIANGLYMRSGIFSSSVFLGIENWKSSKPVFIGDTLQLRLTIADKRLTKDEKRGIIGMQYEVLNQQGDIVAEGLFRRMVNLPQDAQP